MAIPRKQIGWSQESNLLWDISRQMEKLTGVAFNSGGGGGGGVQSVTGLDTDNSDPLNPVVEIAVDNTTIQGSGTSAVPLVATGNLNTECLDLSIGDQTITEPGVYRIINSNGGYNIIFDVNPTDFPGNKVVLINTDTSTAAQIDTGNSYQLAYQGSNTFLSQINAGATFEFFSVYEPTCADFNWRTNTTTSVPTREGISLSAVSGISLSVGIDGGGFYVIDVAGDFDGVGCVGNNIYFPSAASYPGQRIVIINRDVNCNAIIDSTNAPVELDLNPLSYVPASTKIEFISTNNYWWVLSQTTV